jgi:Nif11 domain
MSKENIQTFVEAASKDQSLQQRIVLIQREAIQLTAEKLAKLSQDTGTPFTPEEYLDADPKERAEHLMPLISDLPLPLPLCGGYLPKDRRAAGRWTRCGRCHARHLSCGYGFRSSQPLAASLFWSRGIGPISSRWSGHLRIAANPHR